MSYDETKMKVLSQLGRDEGDDGVGLMSLLSVINERGFNLQEVIEMRVREACALIGIYFNEPNEPITMR